MARLSNGAATSSSRSAIYRNGILNVFWSALCIAPIFVYCYRFIGLPWFYGSAAVSLVGYLIQAAGLRRLQLSGGTGVYRLLRVPLLIRFTQDGGTMKGVSKTESVQAAWFRDPVALQKMVRVTYGRERFHLALLLFFLFAAVYAGVHRQVVWSLLLCLSNVIYNLYPVWLQQYIRLRLQRCLVRLEKFGTFVEPST